VVNFGVDYFSTNERTKGVNDWMKKNRPDIKIKQVDFTDPEVAQIAGHFSDGNNIRDCSRCGTSRHWTRSPHAGAGREHPRDHRDLGTRIRDIDSKGGRSRATGSQRPYESGVAEDR